MNISALQISSLDPFGNNYALYINMAPLQK